MESMEALVGGDSVSSENEVTPNSSIVNDVPVPIRNQNSISNRSSAQTTFINHERKRSISNIGNDFSNNEHLFSRSRSSFSSNEDGPNKRPPKQEVNSQSNGLNHLCDSTCSSWLLFSFSFSLV